MPTQLVAVSFVVCVCRNRLETSKDVCIRRSACQSGRLELPL